MKLIGLAWWPWIRSKKNETPLQTAERERERETASVSCEGLVTDRRASSKVPSKKAASRAHLSMKLLYKINGNVNCKIMQYRIRIYFASMTKSNEEGGHLVPARHGKMVASGSESQSSIAANAPSES